MAILKDPILSRYRNTVGGVTRQLSWYGPGARRRTKPRSISNKKSQYATSHLASIWHSMTPTQQADWQTFADNHPITDRYGASFSITNWLMFQRLRLAHLMRNVFLGIVPPADLSPAYNPQIITATIGMDQQIYVQLNEEPISNYLVLFYYQINQSRLSPDYLPLYLFGSGVMGPASGPYAIADGSQVISGQGYTWLACIGYDDQGRKSDPFFLSVAQ